MFLRAARANNTTSTPAHGRPAKSIAPPSVNRVLNSPGRPLDAATRAFVEARFGHNFSHVRIHDDQRAVESAQAVDALAYTVGPHVAFANQFRPSQPRDLRVLAHELAHVVQQDGVPFAANEKIEIGCADDRSEKEADEFAWSVIKQTPHYGLNRTGLRVARQTKESSGAQTTQTVSPQALMNDANSLRTRLLARSKYLLSQLQIICNAGARFRAMELMPEQVRPFVAWMGLLPTDAAFCPWVNAIKALVEAQQAMTLPPLVFAGPDDAECKYRDEFAFALHQKDGSIKICPKTVDPARTSAMDRALVLIHELFHDPKFQMEHPEGTMNTEHCGSLGPFEALSNPYCVTNVIGSLGGGYMAVL
jgi:Domain of unknown function (DUF4157)